MTEIDELARALFAAADPGGIWAAEDEATRLHWRREAQRQLQQTGYKTSANSL